MTIYTDINNLPHFEKAVITIGTFDGVHPGHLQIIRQLIDVAQNINGTPVVITFHPHPKKITGNSNDPVYNLNTTEEKSILLEAAGIKHLVIVPFTQAFADQSAQDYIENFLFSCLHPHTIIIGYDHRFGNNREGDYRLLEEKSADFGYKVIEISKKVLEDITVSSTAIRKNLVSGNISKANFLLGYHYFIHGEVIHGNKLGRTIGFPTANIGINDTDKLIPADGVYAVKVQIPENKNVFSGMMNIGFKPTVDGKKRSLEVNIFDFGEDIYGMTIKIEFIARIRDEMRFEGLEQLKSQLKVDKEMASALLK